MKNLLFISLFFSNYLFSQSDSTNDTLYYRIFRKDTLYRQSPQTRLIDSSSVSDNWFSTGFRIGIGRKTIMTAPDPKNFKYLKRVKNKKRLGVNN